MEDAAQPEESLEEVLGHRFASPALLALALCHPSAGAKAGSNQRLEFLGDRVLGMVVAAMLYEAFPHEAEGALSHRYSALVRREALGGRGPQPRARRPADSEPQRGRRWWARQSGQPGGCL